MKATNIDDDAWMDGFLSAGAQQIVILEESASLLFMWQTFLKT